MQPRVSTAFITFATLFGAYWLWGGGGCSGPTRVDSLYTSGAPPATALGDRLGPGVVLSNAARIDAHQDPAPIGTPIPEEQTIVDWAEAKARHRSSWPNPNIVDEIAKEEIIERYLGWPKGAWTSPLNHSPNFLGAFFGGDTRDVLAVDLAVLNQIGDDYRQLIEPVAQEASRLFREAMSDYFEGEHCLIYRNSDERGQEPAPLPTRGVYRRSCKVEFSGWTSKCRFDSAMYPALDAQLVLLQQLAHERTEAISSYIARLPLKR